MASVADACWLLLMSVCLLQVNTKVLKAATGAARGLLVADPSLEPLAREARCAAFSCGAALVIATQRENESIFAIPLKGPTATDPAGDPAAHIMPNSHITVGVFKYLFNYLFNHLLNYLFDYKHNVIYQWPSYRLTYAGPWKQLLDITQELTFSVEVDAMRQAAFKRASTSVKAVTERIRADRLNAASLAASGTLGLAGSIGSFGSQASSLSSKISASQYSLGKPRTLHV